MFNAIQPKTPDAVLAGLQQHGASVGAKKLMQWEFKHARDALLSGIYVTLYNEERLVVDRLDGLLLRVRLGKLINKGQDMKLK